MPGANLRVEISNTEKSSLFFPAAVEFLRPVITQRFVLRFQIQPPPFRL